MSRIGKLPIDLPSAVTVAIKDNAVEVKGPKGTLTYIAPSAISVEQKENQLICKRENDQRYQKALHGLVRSLVRNMVIGVEKGFMKELEIHGVGYRAKLEGKKLVMSLGFSHPINFLVPEGIQLQVNGTKISVSGIDKQQVGAVAAKIRDYYPPEPYKGKGIRYVGEMVRRKAGKTVGK